MIACWYEFNPDPDPDPDPRVINTTPITMSEVSTAANVSAVAVRIGMYYCKIKKNSHPVVMWENDEGIVYVFVVFLVIAGLLFLMYCAACVLIGCNVNE